MKKSDTAKDTRLYNKNFLQACNNAINGIIYCATTQTNIRKQLILGTIAVSYTHLTLPTNREV